MPNPGHEAPLQTERQYQSLWQLYLTCEDILIWWTRQNLQATSTPLAIVQSELVHELRLKVRAAIKYTIQVCTSRGKDDFDPDAMWMTLENKLFRTGFWSEPASTRKQDMSTENGQSSAPPASRCSSRDDGLSDLEWAVQRWNAEVAFRPLQNLHRRTLDGTWRQVIRRLGGCDVELCGPRHDGQHDPAGEEKT